MKGLCRLPSVQKALDALINEGRQVREPIKRTKALLQTRYITTGYAWCQSAASVTLYVNFDNADEIPKTKYSLDVLDRSIELNIFDYKGVNHNFKINQLCDFVKPENSTIKFKQDKIVIILKKRNAGSDWPDLRMKSTHKTFHELERHEKSYTPKLNTNYTTPFTNGIHCHHDELNKKNSTGGFIS
ncbi:hypothetical protein INT47_004606 [Mucor saturninus]|uniref:CS domain-containing protein n=1 Tax=Mucor saturninus TaxID=64648 RepID=A0A8H7RI67_9FUNG|nr:hypothetical protein INT47_004606 [Mucor saturninus]